MSERKMTPLEMVFVLLFAIPLYFICFWFAVVRGRFNWKFIDNMVDNVYDVMLEWNTSEDDQQLEPPRFIDGAGHAHRHRRGHRGGRKHRKHHHD